MKIETISVWIKKDNNEYRLRFGTMPEHFCEIWIESGAGEGMSIPESDLFDMIDKYFRDNF